MEMVLEANLLLIVTDKFLQLKDGKKPWRGRTLMMCKCYSVTQNEQ
jgi:hypothetical protein